MHNRDVYWTCKEENKVHFDFKWTLSSVKPRIFPFIKFPICRSNKCSQGHDYVHRFDGGTAHVFCVFMCCKNDRVRRRKREPVELTLIYISYLSENTYTAQKN